MKKNEDSSSLNMEGKGLTLIQVIRFVPLLSPKHNAKITMCIHEWKLSKNENKDQQIKQFYHHFARTAVQNAFFY